MTTTVFVAAGILAFLILGLFAMFAKFYRKIEQGRALIVNTLRAEPEVTFTGRMVYPIIHKAELMDISLKTVEIDRSGNEGLICKDNIRADIKVKFFVRVNKTAEDVLKVAQGIGCERASSQETLEELFSAKFSEALKTVGKSMDFVDLYGARDRFRDEIIRQIGDDLSGYVLEDAAIDYLEQTPIGKLDSNNILDAQGIRKITELTATEHVRTNELRRNGEMQIKKKDVETQETMLELERQAADAQAKQGREIATVRAREDAETKKVQAEEKTKAELARLQSEQFVTVQQENVLREKEVAENNRKRAVAIEEEKVTRARELEIVDREKEVTLQRIEKDKAVEVQKKAIADVIRERIVVERTVAEQEEAIKEVRVVAEADRTRKAVVIHAEAQAEEKMVIERQGRRSIGKARASQGGRRGDAGRRQAQGRRARRRSEEARSRRCRGDRCRAWFCRSEGSEGQRRSEAGAQRSRSGWQAQGRHRRSAGAASAHAGRSRRQGKDRPGRRARACGRCRRRGQAGRSRSTQDRSARSAPRRRACARSSSR